MVRTGQAYVNIGSAKSIAARFIKRWPGASAAAGAALLAAGIPVAALAQTSPVAPPTRDELVPPQPRMEQPSDITLTIDGGMARTPCALDDPDLADIRVTLTRVSFVGAQAAAGADLLPAYTPYLGRELPISVLCDIRVRANAILTDAGYLAAVEIPEQRLEGGAAEFRVILGRLTALRVRGDAGPSERVVAAYLGKLAGREVFNTHDAERYLLLADDIPGLDVRLALRPAVGGQPGDLIGEVAVLRRRAALDLNIQNYGSRAIGRFGGLLRAELYDLTGMGDRTSISAYSSHDFDEQQTLQIGHDFLAGADGLRLGGQLTLGWTNPSVGIPGFDIKSNTVFGSLYANYPLVRTQARSVFGSFGLDIVNQNVNANTVALSRDRVRTAWARVEMVETDTDSIARRNGYSPFEPRARASASVEVRQGLGIMGANVDCRSVPANCIAANQLPTRIEQDPSPLLARAELHGEYRPLPVITLAVDLEGQYTSDPLPAFEELTGGNYSVGRGYDPAAVTGDKGIAATIELRFGSLVPESLDSVSLQPYLFIDSARVWDRDPSQRAANPDGLMSVGSGLRFTYARGVQGDLTLAVPLKRTDSQRLNGEERNDVRLLFSLTSRLLPWRF